VIIVDLQHASDSLWAYCLERYDYPNVKEYSLTWQDKYNGNVNAVFALLWAQQSGVLMRALDAPKWQHLVTQTQHVLVDPIREQRKAITDKSSPYYALLLQDELDAERRQQQHFLQYIMTLQEPSPALQSHSHFIDYIDWHCTTQLHSSRFSEGIEHAKQLASMITAVAKGYH
jgi:uncharacterized protein (TIGR02444 family)